jgi:glycosyltransferase involved in cell wall biosynthesis
MLLPNCVETENSVGLRVEMTGFTDLGFDLSHHVFGCVGNIRKAKNQALFVRAMVQVVARHPDARGVVIGETLAGEEEARIEVEREIERLGLAGRVVLTGFREDVQSLMPHLAALCLTSESEGMPNVVLEAMAAGVPVVATAVGGVPEIVADGSTGWLVPAGDEAAFANAMCRVLEAPEEALQMAGEAKARVEEEHNCPAMARRLEAAYAEALEVGGLA